MLPGNLAILICDDEDDPLPSPTHALPHTLKRPAPPSVIQQAPKQFRSYAHIATAYSPVPADMWPNLPTPREQIQPYAMFGFEAPYAALAAAYNPVPAVKIEEIEPKMDPHILLSIENNRGYGDDHSEWHNLDVIGVFSTKEAAMERKEEILDENEDNFCVRSWGDTTSLVVKQCPMFGFETLPDFVRPEGATTKKEPHVLLSIPSEERIQYDDEDDWDDLEVIGVFPTEEAAEEKREELACPDEEDGSWSVDDGMDMVVKSCDMFGFDASQQIQSFAWSNILQVIGVFSTQEAAEEKRDELACEEACDEMDWVATPLSSFPMTRKILCQHPALSHKLKRPAPPSATKPAPKQIRSYETTAATPAPVLVVVRPKKVKPKADPHVLLWIPHNGIQDHEGNDWDALDVIGVFYTEAAAAERLEELMDEHADEQFGNGHICVGDSWSDEIDLVVKSCIIYGSEQHRRMLSGNPILLLSDDEDDPLPAPSDALTHTLKRPAPPSATQPAPKQIRSYAAIAAAHTPVPVVVKPKKVKPKTNKEKPHVLLWIPHNGLKPSQKNNWPSLKVIGVFYTKEAAEARKAQLMNQHETYGHGDICVGDTWNDEIDLVVKPCDMFGFEGL
ncbi:hypothetical protein HDU80_007823 [Chytriomyces hyalinus]|nr:hypothetical protein HDU80_007823 [Chytriomyces hyalinus]